MSDPKDARFLKRAPELRKVALGDMVINERAQRGLSNAQGDSIAANLKIEGIGYPVLSYRDGVYYVVDGQHRIYGLRKFGFEPTDKFPCEVYEGLTEEQEAELFLERNQTRVVLPFDKFRIGLTARRGDEMAIDAIVREADLVISRRRKDGISAVGTLRKVYLRDGAEGLAKALRIIRDSLGMSGFSAEVIDGVARVCRRFGDRVDEEIAINQLGRVKGGVNGVEALGKRLYQQFGTNLGHCMGAAVTEIYNKSLPTKSKLPSWWK